MFHTLSRMLIRLNYLHALHHLDLAHATLKAAKIAALQTARKPRITIWIQSNNSLREKFCSEYLVS